MQGDSLTQVLLPLGLMFIMFSLGVGLSPADFQRVWNKPRAFAVGVVVHFLLLPLISLVLIHAFGISGALAVGFMVIAACPTGTTSNLLTAYARGDVALALSFTAFAGAASIISVPLIVTAAVEAFLQTDQQIDLSASHLMGQVFAIIGMPVMAGMVLRRLAPRFAKRIERPASLLAGLVFVLIFVASIIKHWALFREHLPALGPVVFTLNALMLSVGYGLARAARLELDQSVTLAIESSVQNGTLAIVIGSTMLNNDTTVLPGAIYSVVMCINGLVFVVVARWLARRQDHTRSKAEPRIPHVA